MRNEKRQCGKSAKSTWRFVVEAGRVDEVHQNFISSLLANGLPLGGRGVVRRVLWEEWVR